MFRTPHFLFDNTLEGEFFVGKRLASALKPFQVLHVNKKKRENASTHDFVDKSLCEERGPPLS